MAEQHTYKSGEVVKLVDGLSTTDLLRKWVKEFNIQVERTEKGQFRFTQKNVEELQAISEKINIENYSWKQVKAWRNGEDIIDFEEYKEYSKVDKLIEQIEELKQESKQERELNKQGFQAMMQRLDDVLLENKQLREDNEELKKGQLRLQEQLQLQAPEESSDQESEDEQELQEQDESGVLSSEDEEEKQEQEVEKEKQGFIEKLAMRYVMGKREKRKKG